MTHHLKTLARVTIFLAIGAGILYMLYRGQNAKFVEDCALRNIAPEDCSLIQKVWKDFLSVNAFWLTGVLIAFMMSNVSRAMRWMMLFQALGFRVRFVTAFFTIMFGYFANLGIPRIGEVLRAAMVGRYEGIPVDKAVGTVVVDRVMDGLTLLLMIIIAFVFEFDVVYSYITDQLNLESLLGKLIIPGIVLVVGSTFALWYWRRTIVKFPLIRRFSKTLYGLVDGMRSVKTVKNPGLFIFHTLFIWLMYFLMNYWCLKAFDPTASLGYSATLIIFVFGALGILFPSPGGMGTYHYMIGVALAIYGISGDDAFSFANILYFSVQIFCNVIFGVAALIALPLIHRKQPQQQPL